MFGRPYYDEHNEGESLWNTVLWAFGALGQRD